jgi:hypothetical protein
MHKNEQEARKLMRDFQSKYGHRISPSQSILLNNGWNDAFAKDSTGLQAKRFAENLFEEFEPMKR